jgi:hypothetical protein
MQYKYFNTPEVIAVISTTRIITRTYYNVTAIPLVIFEEK